MHISKLAALAALATLTACASLGTSPRQASALPIQTSGSLLAFRAHETADRLYVSGTAQRHPLARRAHVDVQLVAASGRIIAERQDDIVSPSPAPGGGPRHQDSFVASFPLGEARQAARIRISVHEAPSHS